MNTVTALAVLSVQRDIIAHNHWYNLLPVNQVNLLIELEQQTVMLAHQDMNVLISQLLRLYVSQGISVQEVKLFVLLVCLVLTVIQEHPTAMNVQLEKCA